MAESVITVCRVGIQLRLLPGKLAMHSMLLSNAFRIRNPQKLSVNSVKWKDHLKA